MVKKQNRPGKTLRRKELKNCHYTVVVIQYITDTPSEEGFS